MRDFFDAFLESDHMIHSNRLCECAVDRGILEELVGSDSYIVLIGRFGCVDRVACAVRSADVCSVHIF